MILNNLLFVINSIALGIGLAMDAFSVSLANGLREPAMNKKRMLLIAGTYALFQFLMPMLGWFAVHTAVGIFTVTEPYIPWIALLLLLFIGGKMIRESIRQRREKPLAELGGESHNRSDAPEGQDILGPGTLLAQGVATSIDALSVGFTIVEYQVLSAVAASLIIAIVTLVICLFGLRIGKAFGTRFSGFASLLGGFLLVAIGVEIFIRGVL